MRKLVSVCIAALLFLTLLSACHLEKPVSAAPDEHDPVVLTPESVVPIEDPISELKPVQEEHEPREVRDRPVDLVAFTGRVEHIFIHPLIPYPEKTFKSSQALGFDDWFVTVDEFARLLVSLHQRDFVLVNMHDVYEEYQENGKSLMRRKTLLLPEGKKPLILSIDDLNYYAYMIKAGLVHKLILDENGEITTYGVNPQGQEVISRENDVVPILDDFVKEHPDFSHRGAKAIIALTGYEGILGYRTQTNHSGHQPERDLVAPIVDRLKETGWIFASHSFGHPNMTTMSYNYLVSDTRRWKQEVEPLIGFTNILIYPFGARVQEGSDKFNYLLEQGFRVFCAVGPNSHERISTRYSAVMTDRRSIDGITLRDGRHHNVFNAAEIIDLSVRPKR